MRRGFAFFGNKISPKFGEKCCRYGLNGKPFEAHRVATYYDNLKDELQGWRISEDSRSLYRYFYCEDYLAGITLMRTVVEIDGSSTQNLPNMEITNGNLVKVELTSHPLKGLSHIDFELAIRLNKIDLDALHVVPVENPQNYRAEVRLKKQDKESKDFQKMLQEQEGLEKRREAPRV